MYRKKGGRAWLACMHPCTHIYLFALTALQCCIKESRYFFLAECPATLNLTRAEFLFYGQSRIRSILQPATLIILLAPVGVRRAIAAVRTRNMTMPGPNFPLHFFLLSLVVVRGKNTRSNMSNLSSP